MACAVEPCHSFTWAGSPIGVSRGPIREEATRGAPATSCASYYQGHHRADRRTRRHGFGVGIHDQRDHQTTSRPFSTFVRSNLTGAGSSRRSSAAVTMDRLFQDLLALDHALSVYPEEHAATGRNAH